MGQTQGLPTGEPAPPKPEATSRPPKVFRWWIHLAALFVVVAGAFGYRYLTRSPQDDLPFDALEWRQHDWDQDGYSTRYRMVGDLLRRHKLVGMTRAEVEALLGRIEFESVNSRYPYPGYDLGQVPGGAWMPHGTTLPIQFGPDGRVIKVWNPGK